MITGVSGVDLADLAQELEAVHARHLDVDEQDVGGARRASARAPRGRRRPTSTS